MREKINKERIETPHPASTTDNNRETMFVGAISPYPVVVKVIPEK